MVRWAPRLVIIAAAFVGLLPPLYDLDLGHHLAMGEWMVRHRAVPFTEPFAWTRLGEPYFAYSWLAQTLYYLLLHHFGPIALHLLQGLTAGAAAAAALWAGRQLGCGHAARLGFAILNTALLWGMGPALRPQQLLFVALPLAWGIAARIHAGRRTPWVWLLALTGVGALAANTHLFFPLTAVPLAYFALTGRQPSRWALPALALAAGWLLTPYALAWPHVFALNFGDNPLLRRPAAIIEFVPGFEYAAQRPGVILVVLTLLAAPWLAPRDGLPLRQRLAGPLMWTLGLVLFAYAGRLVLVWWTLAFPLVAAAAERLASLSSASFSPAVRRFGGYGVAALALFATSPEIRTIFWLYEGDTVHRMLPRAAADPALWLPSWLVCHTRAGAGGRLYTEFNYGSELTWRLPGYSPSIDGRTIFPASEAMEYTLVQHGRRRTHADTWRAADLALLDRSHWLAPVLDEDDDWVLLADGHRTARGRHGALWAKRDWWSRWGTDAELPATGIVPGDPRGKCPAAGRFPW
jgi:hypothetical protein